ncbi:MAG: HYR domain-containing protein, partial [Bacteroidota bacterium]
MGLIALHTNAETGSAVLCADNFDSGSYDNCFLQSIRIRRMDEEFFKDCIRVDCDDVGTPVMVVLRATDYEGLTDDCMIRLSVDEKVPPMLECAEDITVDCTTDINQDLFYAPVAMDNCGTPTVTYVDDDQRDQCGVGQVIRTYTAEDKAGNTSTCVQIITLEQNKEPLVFFPSDRVFNSCKEAFDTDVAGEPTLYNYCSDLLVGHEDEVFRSEDGCTLKILRIWSVLDWCSFEETLDTQIIKVFDNTPPVITNPAGSLDQTFTCPDDIVLVEPTAEDDCTHTTISITSDETIAGDCPSQFIRNITYVANDNCGNVSEPFLVTITVNDDVAPTADPLPELGPFQCFEDIPSADPEDVMGEADNCGGLVFVTHLGDSPDPGCSGTVTRSYELADECGNTSVVTQQIIIEDNTAPTTNPLPDLGPFACFPDLPEPDVNIVQATDNCGAAVTVTHMGDSPDPGCNGVVVRTYVATDECGNSSTVTQNLLVRDEEPPTADELSPIGPVDCYENRPAPDVSIVNATDNCGQPVSVSFISDSEDPGCTGSVIRIYLITDVCGNSAEVRQSIFIDDNVAPTADPIASIGPFICESDVPAPDINVVTGERDNCGGPVSVAFARDEPAPTCQGMYRRFYQLTDECGNVSELMQEIAINDDIMPTADPLPNLGPFACLEDIPAPNIADVTGAMDNCGMVMVSFVSDTTPPDCEGSVVRTYRIADECGNTVDITQQISLNDNIPPTADPLEDAGPFSCATEIPDPDINIVTNASDNCTSPVTVEHVGDSDAPLCEGVVTRTYRISDVCGNSIELTQNFSIRDTIAPSANARELGPFQCYEDIPEPDNTTIFDATDNCTGTIRITFIGPDAGDPGCSGIVERMWRLRDECGNSRILIQNIFIDDTIAPTADPLPDLGPFDCLEDVPEPDVEVVTNEMDNCGDTVFVAFLEDVNVNTCKDTIRRIYRIEDECGNFNDLVQKIVVNDETPPSVLPLDNLGPFSCLDDIPAPDTSIVQTGADNCGVVTVEFAGDTDSPGCSGFITRTYRVTDDCGNAVEVTQQIELNDNIAPTADPLTNAGPFDCATKIPAPDVSIVTNATDNCGGEVFVEFAGDSPAPLCTGLVTRTYRVSDVCGNAILLTQNFSILDTIAPTARARELGPFACYEEIPEPDNTTIFDAVDNCTGTIRITYIGPDAGDPGCEGIVERKWRLRDECGNSRILIQNIFINDTIPPTADPLPALGTFACSEDI